MIIWHRFNIWSHFSKFSLKLLLFCWSNQFNFSFNEKPSLHFAIVLLSSYKSYYYSASTDLTDVTDPRANETTISGSRVARQQKDKNVVLIISTAVVFLFILVAVTFCVWMKRNVDHQSITTNNGVYLLLIT